jgi:peptide/nickel transport system substrate-binding protein
MLKEWIQQQRAVLAKTPNWWGGPVNGPDEVVYRVMREDEVRVTALLNNEIQIAQDLPPQQVERVNNNPSTAVAPGESITIMFLAMRPDTKPFDNKLVRQAVAHAIDRDAIIKGVLLGYAEKLEAAVGPGQYGYDPNLKSPYAYDPAKAKQLLAQAGYPDGVDVELNTPVGTYVKAKEVVESMIPMLNAVGIRAKQLTPEGPTLFTQIQEGKIPFFYFGRGSVRDAGQPLSQYFETGISKRIGYSSPQVDALFRQERAAFNPEERKKLLSQIQSQLIDEVPAHFLWRYKLLWGVSKSVEWTPRSDEGVYANTMRLK